MIWPTTRAILLNLCWHLRLKMIKWDTFEKKKCIDKYVFVIHTGKLTPALEIFIGGNVRLNGIVTEDSVDLRNILLMPGLTK